MTNNRSQKWLDFLVQKRRQSGYALLALCALLAAATIWIASQYKWEYFTIAAGLGWLAVVCLGAGFFQVRREADAEPNTTRSLVLTVAGLAGLIISAMGLVLAWQWWDVYLAWLKSEPGKEGWKMWLSLVAFFGGLAIMFAGLQLARTEERSNPVFRRLLYGYNTVLTTLLVLAILLVVNVLVYMNFATAVDFTSANLYSLSSRSKNILK